MGEPAIKISEGKTDTVSMFEVKSEAVDLGSGDSLRRHILTWVLEGRYEKAIDELRVYLDSNSQYPGLKDKVHRYVNHSIDLIHAIKAKRSFPGVNSLTRSKQFELREKFIEHFKELQYILKTVEKIEYDIRLNDVRSTVYVVKAIWLAGISIAILGFWIEIVNGLAKTSLTVADDGLVKLVEYIAGTIGF